MCNGDGCFSTSDMVSSHKENLFAGRSETIRADNEISSGKVCEILHLLLLFMMLFPAFLHCLQTTTDGFGAESASYRCSSSASVSSSKQSNRCCIQTAFLHPGMELQGELTHWELDLSNCVTVDWATGCTSSCPQ